MEERKKKRRGGGGMGRGTKPWRKNCTVPLDHCDTAPTVSLLLLQYSQVHTDSQSTGVGRRRKEPLCTQEKCHFTVIKRQCVLCTVMKIEPCALWIHTFSRKLTIPGTKHAFLFGKFLWLEVLFFFFFQGRTWCQRMERHRMQSERKKIIKDDVNWN